MSNRGSHRHNAQITESHATGPILLLDPASVMLLYDHKSFHLLPLRIANLDD